MEIARAEGGEAVFDRQSAGELTITALYVIHDAKRDGDVERDGARLAANVGSRYQGGPREAWLDGGFIVKRSPVILLSRDGMNVLGRLRASCLEAAPALLGLAGTVATASARAAWLSRSVRVVIPCRPSRRPTSPRAPRPSGSPRPSASPSSPRTVSARAG
jgi:hypothetical protein